MVMSLIFVAQKFPCPMSNLGNRHVTCHFNQFGHVVSPRLRVAFRIQEMFISPCRYKASCRVSNLKNDRVAVSVLGV